MSELRELMPLVYAGVFCILLLAGLTMAQAIHEERLRRDAEKRRQQRRDNDTVKRL